MKYRGNSNYRSNQGVLAEDKFVILPYGSVQPKEWLRHQLYLQKHGMLGVMDKYNEFYNEHSGWLGGDGESWEKGPYYLRGLLAVAYTLNDDELKAKAQKWIDSIITMQRDNGFFGAESEGNGEDVGEFDWWPAMVVVQLIRDYYEATVNYGHPDERAIEFLRNYFHFQYWRLDTKEFAYWANARGADNIEVVLWFYNFTYDPENPEKNAWLIELAEKIKKYTADWSYRYSETSIREHVVNIEQARKYPAVVWQLTKSDYDRDAFYEGLKNLNTSQGRVDTLPNADEFSRDILPYHGTELCAVVEGMLSTEITLRILGDAPLADRIEKLAYNTLPTLYAPDQTGHAYFTAQNQAIMSHGYHHAIHDQGDSFSYSSPSGCECCFPNNGMGYAKFIQTMWMATCDDGLAALTYGPNRVTARVADGKTAVFDTVTDYPFDEKIAITYYGDTAQFPLKLRIPAWCAEPEISLNGERINQNAEDGYVVLMRTWNTGDAISIRFPMSVRTSLWCNEAIAVERGPLIFSTAIPEDYRKTDSNDCRHCDYPPNDELPMNEVFTGGKWNYGIIFDDHDPDSFKVSVKDVALQPFTYRNAPVSITVSGQLIPDWHTVCNYVPETPYGNIALDRSLPVGQFNLIPMGCARLKITQLPRIAKQNACITRVAQSGTSYVKNNMKILEFGNITLPYAEDYSLSITYSGKGMCNLKINNKAQLYINFEEDKTHKVVAGLKGLIEDEWLQFRAGNYNTVAFIGNDVTVESIEIIPSGTQPKPAIIGAHRTPGSATLETNVSPNTRFYSLRYGTEPGVYTHVATGFDSTKAIITGLDDDKDYYFKLFTRNSGVMVSSEEFTVTRASVVPSETKVPDIAFDGDLIIDTESCFETGVIKYARIAEATGYKLAYGTHPDELNNEIYNFIFNIYYTESLKADKISVPGLTNGKKYYVKLYALVEDRVVAESGVHSLIAGQSPDFERERGILRDTLAKAETAPGNAVLAKAIAEAKDILQSSNVNRMDCDVAVKNLIIGMEDF